MLQPGFHIIMPIIETTKRTGNPNKESTASWYDNAKIQGNTKTSKKGSKKDAYENFKERILNK